MHATLVPVDVRPDRVIRTTVGLRPFHPGGFQVRTERLDLKTVVHNYGHGGAGHSLAWGTGLLATELALQHPDRVAAVLGCGIAGLTAARQLQRHGFDVTIYARALPPETTSNLAWAGFTPQSSVVEGPRRTPAWDAAFRRAAVVSYEELQRRAGRGIGVSWIDSYSFMNRAPRPAPPDDDDGLLLPRRLRMTGVALGPGEHPFPSPWARRRPMLRIEPTTTLEALVLEVREAGGRIQVRSFGTRRDLMALDERLIVNCIGLGTRQVFGDLELTPVQGQITMLVPQPDVRYATFGGVPDESGSAFPIHMMPRADGIALGGTSRRGVWSLDPDPEAERRILAESAALYAGMRAG